ncbi:hypothetical protein niasHS_016017 [Heterodera schachtii]|uniref:Glutathione synthetase n=1 Tax=Heterodera schachtii TaxID=97005 RepID=A0ABD2HR00_HETSC
MMKYYIILFVFHLTNFANGSPSQDDIDDEQKQQYCVTEIEHDPKILLERSQDATDWALSNGLIKLVPAMCQNCRIKMQNQSFVAELIPISLYPSPFPGKLFRQAMEVHKAMLLLYFRASQDFAFLKETHRQLVESNEDNKIKKMISLLDGLYEEGIKQPVAMFCQRSDYMASQNDDGEYLLKQVEVNTGALGGVGACSRVSEHHKRMVANAGIDASEAVMPLDQTDLLFAETLYEAWKQFDDKKAVILFVHNQPSQIKLDSRKVQYQLEKIATEQIICRFITLSEGLKRLKIDPVNFNLILDDKFVVAVVFDRLGGPITRPEAALNFSFERTTAIKTPPYVFSIAHTKKMQQVFTKPGMVERFFPDPKEAHIVEAIRRVQAKSWALGDDENEADEIKKKVYENPQNYVLKTNECGTPNQRLFFNDDIPKKLARMTPAEHNYFYIMEKLRPMVVKNHFVRPKIGFTANLDVTPELGIYGCLIGNMVTGEVSYVSRFGHTMKTKTADEDEGGIMRGNSVADTPYLV